MQAALKQLGLQEYIGKIEAEGDAVEITDAYTEKVTQEKWLAAIGQRMLENEQKEQARLAEMEREEAAKEVDSPESARDEER